MPCKAIIVGHHREGKSQITNVEKEVSVFVKYSALVILVAQLLRNFLKKCKQGEVLILTADREQENNGNVILRAAAGATKMK